jgi:LysR family transcriptional activator of nhaA
MEWLNYHHLLYFWLAAREGGITRAAATLRLAHPTVSGQIHALEDALGEKLFAREGRKLVLTEMGRVVYGYADEIFRVGRELLDTVKGRPTGRPLRLVVGIAEVVPKLVAKRLLDPARSLSEPVRLVCREDRTDRLVAELAAGGLDVVLTDVPLGHGARVRAFNHLLGESPVTLFAAASLAAQHRRGFPASLEGAPMLLPGPGTALRGALDAWLESRRIRPSVEAEFDDPALLKAFGQDGVGIFPAPTAIEAEVRRQYRVEVVGRIPEVRESFYAISPERRLRHPAVVAISTVARDSFLLRPGAGVATRR